MNEGVLKTSGTAASVGGSEGKSSSRPSSTYCSQIVAAQIILLSPTPDWCDQGGREKL